MQLNLQLTPMCVKASEKTPAMKFTLNTLRLRGEKQLLKALEQLFLPSTVCKFQYYDRHLSKSFQSQRCQLQVKLYFTLKLKKLNCMFKHHSCLKIWKPVTLFKAAHDDLLVVLQLLE